jgi:glucose 1-dehydrogenase
MASQISKNHTQYARSDLSGKVATVTGAGSGIGRAIALELSEMGGKVVCSDINAETCEKTAKEIRDRGQESISFRVDVADWESVQKLVNYTVSSFGRIDVMVNNAGTTSRGKDILELEVEEYLRTIGVNQHGVFYGIKAAGQAMKQNQVGEGGRGVIINTASFFGVLAVPNMLPYITSKGAVIALTKSAARDLAKYDIRVVAVAPGFIETPMNAYRKTSAELWDIGQKQNLRARAGKPEQVARVVAFLACDRGSFVNGTTVFADDGASIFKR